jgi:FkbM family methyltransferase
MFISYAQNFEDVMLHRALHNIKNGFFIDIGAQDPIIDSVSQGFVELGWQGVNVEPSFIFAAKLKANRPMDDVIEAVIGCSSGDVLFYDIPDTGLSTTLKHIAERHRGKGYPVNERKVRSLPLDDLLDMYSDRDIHWLKIDAEGAEQDILNSWVASVVRPWIVVVEAIEPLTSTPTHHNWEALILQLGYNFVYFDGVNRFYVSIQRPELTKYFNYGPSYLDNFALATTCPTNSAASIKLLQHRAVIIAHRLLCKALCAEITSAQSEAQHFQRLLLESTSWRFTAPLRRISNAINLLVKHPAEFIVIAKRKLAGKKSSEIATAEPNAISLFEPGPCINPLTPDSTSPPAINPSTPDPTSLPDTDPSQVLRDLERAMAR